MNDDDDGRDVDGVGDVTDVVGGPLTGRRVLVTRERPGELARLLRARGAEVVHVPLITVDEPEDGGAGLRAALDDLDDVDWLAVTSAPGAERVSEAASRHPALRLAAVGTTTARVLAESAGRPVDLVPDVQRADRLAAAFVERCPARQRVLIAQADRAEPTLADALAAAGHDVRTVVAYRTLLRRPDPSEVAGVDALLLASGSAAEAWVEAVGVEGPTEIVAIGPTTAARAHELGLKISSVAADHTLVGIVDALTRRFEDDDVDR